MTIWTAVLRGIGSMVLIFGVGFGVVRMLSFDASIRTVADAQPFVMDILEHLALAILCFGAASGLKTLQQINRRTAQQNAALKRLLPRETTPPLPTYGVLNTQSYPPVRPQPRIDLAPHAPTNWNDYKPHPIVNIAHEKKLARRRRLGAVDDARDMLNERLRRKPRLR